MKRTIRKSMPSRLGLKKMVIADLSAAEAAQINGGGPLEGKNTGGQTTTSGLSIYSGYLGTNCPYKPQKPDTDSDKELIQYP